MPTFYVAQPLGYSIQTAEIDNDAVTYAKIQNVSATDKVLGRSTAGAGDVEEIACTSAGRALIDDANAAAQRTTLGLGDVALETAPLAVAKGGTALAALGTGLQVLRTNAGATALEFATLSSGGTEVKSAIGEWATSFATTSTSLVDVTNATITISGLTSGTTYQVISHFTSTSKNTSASTGQNIAIVIGSTTETTLTHHSDSAASNIEILTMHANQSVTSVTSITSKLQCSVSAGTMTINSQSENSMMSSMAIAQ